jgi:SAM-dependent methyltransferase
MTLLSSLFGLHRRPEVTLWSGELPDRTIAEGALLQSLLERWQRYQASEVDPTIAPVDDMKGGDSPDAARHYMQVGVSALELITEGMLLARRTTIARILDFPCGGGRVTRHLVKFFPEAEISASDIEREKQAFVVSQYGAKPVSCPPDFSQLPPEKYDLIFVGSLFSHLDAGMFARALDFFIRSLAPQGLLVITLHGRYTANAVSAGRSGWRDLILRAVRRFRRGGFGYVVQERTRYGVSYGAAFSAPSWVLQLIESRTDAMVLGFKERAWDHHQDALIVQRLLSPPSPAGT